MDGSEFEGERRNPTGNGYCQTREMLAVGDRFKRSPVALSVTPVKTLDHLCWATPSRTPAIQPSKQQPSVPSRTAVQLNCLLAGVAICRATPSDKSVLSDLCSGDKHVRIWSWRTQKTSARGAENWASSHC